MSDGVGDCGKILIAMEVCFKLFELCNKGGWADNAIGDGEACIDSIPESPECSRINEVRRRDCSINVVSPLGPCKCLIEI